MFRFITNLFTTEETTPSREFKTTLGMESLEQRETPSSINIDYSYRAQDTSSHKTIKRIEKKNDLASHGQHQSYHDSHIATGIDHAPAAKTNFNHPGSR